MDRATPPSWAPALAARRGIQEPFASDGDFWRSVGASADALAAVVVSVVIALLFSVSGVTGAAAWLVAIPFIAAAALVVRAASCGRRSARSSRHAMQAQDAAGRRRWRDAERDAVAKAFAGALLRPRLVGTRT